MGKHIGYNHTALVVSPYGDHWCNLRRIGAVEIFSSSHLNLFLGIRGDEIKRLLLKISLNSLRDGFKKVELKPMLPELTFNIIMRMVAGKRYYGDDVMDDYQRLSLQVSQPEYCTDQIIKGFIQVLLLAGMDTAAMTLEWAMSKLLNHPHILRKVRAQLDSQVGQQQLVDKSVLSKLNYLQAIISETLQLYPAGPLLLPHYSSDDCTIGGYDTPRDTIVLVNAWAVHRDPNLWEDGESFKPEGFENNGDNEGTS